MPSREKFGLSFSLLLVWLWFEFGRPSNPMGIPLLISAILLGGWVLRREKRWTTQSSWFVALLVVMAIGIPLALNTFSAVWATYGMAVTLLCICVPLPSLVTSLRRIKTWFYTFIAVSLYVGGWAVFHDGFGPSGAGGGQDENYVAAMMGMAVAVSYFCLFAERRRFVKLLLALSMAVFLGAMMAADNPSRGGFLGLCAVFLYGVARSPRKWIGVGVAVLMVVGVLGFAGSGYWDEISSIADVHEGTADIRLEVWTIGLRMWGANPIFGVGPGGFRWAVGEYQSADQLAKYGRGLGGSIIAHSLFVELLAELGSVGAVVLIGILWRTWRDLRRVVRSDSERPKGLRTADAMPLRCYADALIAGILACLVNGTFLSLLYFSYLWLFIALSGAVVRVFHSQFDRQPAPGVA
jgi:O-antigen ligase